MSKASEFKEHAAKMRFGNHGDELSAQATVLQDGTLSLNISGNRDYLRGLSPSNALALGKWIVEMYEEKT